MDNKNILKILPQQLILIDYLEDIAKIINEKRKIQRAKSNIVSTATDCFNYGIIVGKQIEREKRKRNINQLGNKINDLLQSSQLSEDEIQEVFFKLKKLIELKKKGL